MVEIQPIGYMLSQTLRVYRNQLVSEFKNQKSGITFEQFIILHLLHTNCNIIQQDLANYMQKDKSIIVRQINGLLEKNFVTRITNSGDKRKKNLILTDAGTEILKSMKVVALEVSNKLLSGVTEDEVENFRRVLDKINSNGCLNNEELLKC
jgi:DNA-binding MarR family transcriptional regulator